MILQQRMSRIIFVLVLFLIQNVARSQTFLPGNSYFGKNNYVEYLAGNFPLIISVPHGGAVTPADIPDRKCGDETVTDSYTINLAQEIRDAIFSITGCYPHIIINNLKRTKLDANRDLNEAACGNESSGQAWTEFHTYLDSATAIVARKSGKGLYIDLHGHGHAIQRLELGYLLTAAQLASNDGVLNTSTYENYTSIKKLIQSNVLKLTHSELLRGLSSLGALFSAKGFPAVPSFDDRYPLTGQSYFSGGYNTERHGSKTSGTIDGIQIECNQDVRFTDLARKDFANKAAEVFIDFLTKHYFPKLAETYNKPVGVSQLALPAISLFPNPVINTLNVQNSLPVDIRIYNFLGEMIFSKKIGIYEEIDLHQLNDGIYLVTLSNGSKMLSSGKMIKNSR